MIPTRRAVVVAAVALPIWLIAGGRMDALDAGKVERFAQRIGFDAAFQHEDRSQAAVVTWPDPRTAPGLGQGWTVVDDTLWREGGGAVREWVLRRGREALSTLAFVSSAGPEPARRFLLARASNNMMIDVPYVRGPADLGTLAVTASPPAPPYYLWVFRNLCLEVTARETPVDALAVARWLQAQSQRSLVRWPEIEGRARPSVRPASARATLGQTVEFRVDRPADAPGPRFLLQVEVNPAQAQLVLEEPARVVAKALAPGTVSLQFHWLDSATLVSRSTTATIDVVP